MHLGAGSSVGAIDNPIQRERHTRIPLVPGSSLKGVLGSLWPASAKLKDDGTNQTNKDGGLVPERSDPDACWLFGQESDSAAAAGALCVGEARVIAFPVRSARHCFAWITCPLVLKRLKSDTDFDLPDVDLGESKQACMAAKNLQSAAGTIILESYCFTNESDEEKKSDLRKIVDCFENLVSKQDKAWQSLPERLCIVHDEFFSHFVEQACDVVTRIRINDFTGTVTGGALFNQEQVPPETLLFGTVHARDELNPAKPLNQRKKATDAIATLLEKLKSEDHLIQVGGDETTGLGLCRIHFPVNLENGVSE